MTPLVDPGTDCEDELPAPADRPAAHNTDMDSELQSVFVDVVSLPAMITPVSDVDRALDAPEYVDAVIPPPAVFPITSRPLTTSIFPPVYVPSIALTWGWSRVGLHRT